MKKILFSAALIFALNAIAAAQTTSSKQATTQKKTTIKKGPKNTNHKKKVLKQESSSHARIDSVNRIKLPLPNRVSDSTEIPAIKQN